MTDTSIKCLTSHRHTQISKMPTLSIQDIPVCLGTAAKDLSVAVTKGTALMHMIDSYFHDYEEHLYKYDNTDEESMSTVTGLLMEHMERFWSCMTMMKKSSFAYTKVLNDIAAPVVQNAILTTARKYHSLKYQSEEPELIQVPEATEVTGADLTNMLSGTPVVVPEVILPEVEITLPEVELHKNGAIFELIGMMVMKLSSTGIYNVLTRDGPHYHTDSCGVYGRYVIGTEEWIDDKIKLVKYLDIELETMFHLFEAFHIDMKQIRTVLYNTTGINTIQSFEPTRLLVGTSPPPVKRFRSGRVRRA